MWAHSQLKAAVLFVTPVLVAIIAYLTAPAVADLPPELAGLRRLGPIVALVFAAAMAITFTRGRVLLAVLTLAFAYAGFELAAHEVAGSHFAKTIHAGIAILVPLDLAALSLLRERGLATRWGMRRLGAILFQAAAVVVLATGRPTDFTTGLWSAPPSLHFLAFGPIPALGGLMIVVALGVAVVATFLRRSAIEAGLTGAIAAVGLALHEAAVPLAFEVFLAYGGVMLAVGVLQDAFRLAFRDELTGLPSRRALNEKLLALSDRYVIAMVDVDHFKQFNDRWGHDVGDQVLKMVAAHLERVGGGRGYRYGGEEFALVFGGRNVRDVMPHLEAVRNAIEQYALAIRSPDRPKDAPGRQRSRELRPRRHTVSVTVSIGVAEPGERNATPEGVLRAADAALYRAKGKGRNRVSR